MSRDQKSSLLAKIQAIPHDLEEFWQTAEIKLGLKKAEPIPFDSGATPTDAPETSETSSAPTEELTTETTEELPSEPADAQAPAAEQPHETSETVAEPPTPAI